MNHTLSVEPTGESQGLCDCCGRTSRTVWGYVHSSDSTIAAYFVQWTVGASEHMPNLDFLIGTWGDNKVNDRVLSAWVFNPSHNSFMITDASKRPAARSSLCSRALNREETLSLPNVKAISASCLDAVWLQDQRIAEIRAFAHDAS
jgi:hypothetical protein